MTYRPSQVYSNHRDLREMKQLRLTKQKSSQSPQKTKQKFKQSRLVLTIFRLAPKIISYARAFSTKMKKKNTHQIMLFPSSIYYQQFISPDRNESLIKQYSRKDKNWYPFYFASGTIFIDNRHLQIFARRKELPVEFMALGFGKAVCFGESVGYTIKQSKKLRSSKSFDKNSEVPTQPRLSSYFNPFQPRLSMQNITSKLKQSISSFTILEQEQPAQPNLSQDQLLIGTNIGYILLTNPKTKKTYNLKISSNNIQINQISVFKNYLMAVAQNGLFLYKLEEDEDKGGVKLRELLVVRVNFVGAIRRAKFVRHSGLFFVFFLDNVGVKKAILKERKVANILFQETICEPDKYNPFTNLKIFHQPTLNRILITASCTKQILFYSYHYIQNKQSLILKMPNPKNPPMNPRTHHYSCIQYFPKPKKAEIGTVEAQNNFKKKQDRNSHNDGRVSGTGYMNGNQETDYVVGREEQHVIIAVSFTERVYFVRVWEDRCQVSKRAKFLNRVIKIQMYNEEGVIIVLHKLDDGQKIGDKQNQDQLDMNNMKMDEKKPKLVIMATLLRKIMSFNVCIHTEILQKISFQMLISRKMQNMQSKTTFKSSICLFNNQLLIMSEESIERVGINSWQQIYKKMLQTENIQLLNFLILLKTQPSIFLHPPASLQTLQKFFPHPTAQNKQILLQYYFQINEQPPLQFISQVLHKQPQILLPFILEHKISNLSQSIKEQLIQYWKNKDQRIVEQLIMAGCQYGWEIAVKKGWMRALRKIVSMGMEIHFPLLKLSAFVVTEVRKLEVLDQLEYQDPDYQAKCNQVIKKIENYCEQMVEYASLAIQYFLDPSQITQLQDLKQFMLTLLNNQILQNCIRYKPSQSIKLLSKLLHNPQRLTLIDNLSIQDFLHFQKQFKHIIRTNYLNVSQCVFSFISQTYREITQVKSYTIDQQNRFREGLFVQHAKLIRMGIREDFDVFYGLGEQREGQESGRGNIKGKFQFTRPYLIEMLMVLVNHNNQYVKQIIHEECIQKQADRDQFQCYIEDMLVKIWMDAKDSPIDNVQTAKIEAMPVQQIKSIMISLQQINSSNNFLLICLMLQLPKSEFSIKILRKFIYSPNPLIQQRIFNWLLPTLSNPLQPQTRTILYTELMNNLKSIIEINKQKSREIVDKYFQNKQKDIIRRIDNDPHLQLEYLQMIINDAIENESDVEEYYLNLYLKLLVQEEPERVVGVLEEELGRKGGKIKYDLQEALKVSLEIEEYAQKNKVETYLYQKLGQIQKCIKSSLKTLQSYFWQYIQAYQSKEQKKQQAPNQQTPELSQPPSQYKQLNKASKKLSLISQMISHKLHSKNDTLRIQLQQKIGIEFNQLIQLIFRQSIKKYDYFKIPFDSMVSITEEVRHQKLKYKGHYLGMLGHYFGKIVVDCFEKNCFHYFMVWLKVQTKIDLNILKKHLFEGYKRIKSQQDLLSNISFIDKIVLLQNINEVLTRMQHCIHSDGQCSTCNQPLSQYQGQAILFNCGHVFHINCIQQNQDGQDYCWQCINKNQIQAMIDHSQINIVEVLQKYCNKKSTNMQIERKQKQKQIIISTQKKRMNRLGIFDKKISTLDNQVEIIDMKIQILDYYGQLGKQ